MKERWFVIADDLSGAAEMAGIARQFGLSVKIISTSVHPGIGEEDVLVVNTETRNLPGSEAARTIRDVLKSFGKAGGVKLFKKTDSLLRGPVEAEILAILGSTSFTSALLVPANPSKGRRIRDEKYFIGAKPLDETEYRHDPEYPRTSSDIRTLMNIGSDRLETQQIDWDHIDGKILVPDLNSVEDISTLIEQKISPGMLLAGGADFFLELLSSKHKPRIHDNGEPFVYPGNRCFIFGSYAETNSKALEFLKHRGYEINTIVGKSLPGIKAGRVVLKLQDQFVEEPDRRDFLLEELSRIASVLAEAQEEPVHFLVTGGRTASLFCRKMGWDQLLVKGMHEDGVVTLIPSGSEHLITVKPGSYNWPEELLNK